MNALSEGTIVRRAKINKYLKSRRRRKLEITKNKFQLNESNKETIKLLQEEPEKENDYPSDKSSKISHKRYQTKTPLKEKMIQQKTKLVPQCVP